MAPHKWSLIVCLGGLLLLGLPTRVKSGTPNEEKKPSSVKECRVHIEKALEQYWDQKEPGNSEDQTGQGEDKIIPRDDEEIQENEENSSQNHQNTDSAEEKENEENELNNEEEMNGQGEEEEDEEEEMAAGNNEAEDDDDESEESEEESRTNEKSGTSAENIENEDEEDEDEEESNEEEETEDTENEEADEDNKEMREEGREVEEEEDEESTEEKEKEQEKSTSEEIEEEDEEDEEEEEEEEENEVEESSTVERSVESEEEQTESEEATGDADRASTGVASELPDEEPSPDQSEASEVPEEAVNVTVSEKEEVTEDEESSEEFEPIIEQEDEEDTDDDDTIENIYEEEEDDDSTATMTYRRRDHIDVILGFDEIGTEYDKEEEKLAQSIFREIKKIEQINIKPMELLYKYADSTTRVLGDAEIFNKPMILFLGPWSAGKTTILNYILGLERTPAALKTGTGITDVDFTLVTYGDKRQVVSGTELVADWRYAGVQKFGQGFLDHFRSIQIPHTLLRKVTIVDTPGILENRKNTERGYPFNDAFQWFIDRADAIYVVLDPTKVDIGGELGSVLDQLKGRDVRFILNKADTIRRSDLMRVVGQLFWNLSPLMSSTEAPVIYAVSLATKPYHPSAPAKFLADQEKNFLYDMKETLDRRVENKILYARRHAVRVRNHAKMVDCYLASYYRHKSIFSSKKNVAKLITENPRDYNIFEGLGSLTNVSRYDVPDPSAYKEFFQLHPLYDFKPLASTCSYFRGCPMDKLDLAITKEIPELFAKYKKAKVTTSDPVKQEGR